MNRTRAFFRRLAWWLHPGHSPEPSADVRPHRWDWASPLVADEPWPGRAFFVCTDDDGPGWPARWPMPTSGEEWDGWLMLGDDALPIRVRALNPDEVAAARTFTVPVADMAEGYRDLTFDAEKVAHVRPITDQEAADAGTPADEPSELVTWLRQKMRDDLAAAMAKASCPHCDLLYIETEMGHAMCPMCGHHPPTEETPT